MTRPLRKLGFLHIVPFRRDAPAEGLEQALRLFEYGEELGFDGGWVRTRHIQYGLPSAAVFLAAAAQRTTRLELGTAVIPTVYDSPLRLAEDLSVADLLSGGRLQPGVSVGHPMIADRVVDEILGADWRERDMSYARVERMLELIRGARVDEEERTVGIEEYSDRVEPHSPGLAERVWYGAGSLRSAEWAGRAGLKLLVSNITAGEDTDDFSEAQRRQIERFRAHHPSGQNAIVAKGAVVVPTDDATPEQAEHFAAYVEARTPRTLQPGANRRLIQRDFSGTTEAIVARLQADPAFGLADEFVFELPFSFDPEDYRTILRSFAQRIGPALGWSPRG